LKLRPSSKPWEESACHPARQRGSHLIMMHPDGWSSVIPEHPGEELWRGILMLKLGLALSRNMLK